jgi:hypothetical protein
METGSELSKTVAIFIVQKILLDETGLVSIAGRDKDRETEMIGSAIYLQYFTSFCTRSSTFVKHMSVFML